MKTPPCDISSGASIAAFLRTLQVVGLHDALNARTIWLSSYDWDFVADPKYLDRLTAVWKHGHRLLVEGPSSYSLAHCLLGPPGKPYWNPIHARPAYESIPAGELPYRPEMADVPFGAKFRMLKDATYYGGECIPAGTIVTAAGYSTSRDIRDGKWVICFESIGLYPDGTYRRLPRLADMVPESEPVVA